MTDITGRRAGPRDLLGLAAATAPDRDQGWRADLAFFARELKQRAECQRVRLFLADLLAGGSTAVDRAGDLRAAAFGSFSRNADPAMNAILAVREHLPGL